MTIDQFKEKKERFGLLQKAKLTDIESLTLDNGEDTLTISLQIPVGSDGEFAAYEETITFGADTSPELRTAARRLADAAIGAIRRRDSRDGPIPCETCTGACCHDPTGAVRVTEQDIRNLFLAYGEKWNVEHIDFYGEVAWTGFSGELRRVDVSEVIPSLPVGTKGCINLTDKGCGIYENRPQVCRDYSCWTCSGVYVEDPHKVLEKKDGRKTLRVVG